MKHFLYLITASALLVTARHACADSATWDLNPSSNDWSTAANWTPATVPNGPLDIATFEDSNVTDVSIPTDTEVDSVVFGQGASAFTTTVAPTSSFAQFTVSGAGVLNSSGVIQKFVLQTGESQSSWLQFQGSATAGTSTSYTLEWTKSGVDQAHLRFIGSSSAGDAIITHEGGGAPDQAGGFTEFHDNATAANATITLNGGTVASAWGSFLWFYGGTAGNATLIANGCVQGPHAIGSGITFAGHSTAGQAVIIANGTLPSRAAGTVRLTDSSSGGTARTELSGTGTLDVTSHNGREVEIGSVEGDGLVSLGKTPLTVGTNDLSTTFSGTIRDGGKGGSLTKIGAGTLTLSGVNSYTGGTTVSEGFLKVANTNGSGTGSGDILISGGTLGGNGIVAGSVTVGSGAGSGASLAPGTGMSTLTIQSALTFKADGSYTCRLNTNRATTDQVVAKGTAIESGAQFTLLPKGNRTLPFGTVFTVINNNGAAAITGTFSNLFDGGTITVGNNTFQANYEGGDGNDLTLTVVP